MALPAIRRSRGPGGVYRGAACRRHVGEAVNMAGALRVADRPLVQPARLYAGKLVSVALVTQHVIVVRD